MARVLGNNKEKLVFLWFFTHLFVSFTLGKDTFARKIKEKLVFLWFFTHLIVSLHTDKE
jgi:hypothetical protein